MGRCAAITREGCPCKGLVRPGNDYCPAHDPRRAEARKKAASKAGKGRAEKLTRSLHRLLEETTTKVLDGKIAPYKASVANSLIGTRIRLLEYERRVAEQDEMLRRLQDLEDALGAQSALGRGRRGS